MDATSIMEFVKEAVTTEVFGVWFLIGAALVFFMQAGFAMVETGFTRAKNAGNIIMKNLMDFCIGTVVFVLLGFGLMMAEDYVFGLVGVPNLDIFTDFGGFIKENASSFVFNLVFCATAATIVSGAMAERTKFVSYCIYSGVISLVVYPIEAGWVWNSQGWLAQWGFHDFAGSAAIHSVGGLTALIGAIMVGPRLGKYVKDKAGKVTKVNAIPGHSITLGALGCFILWFGWYGFNGAAAWDGTSLASIFLTTTIAPAVATCTTMIFTWIKNGKPETIGRDVTVQEVFETVKKDLIFYRRSGGGLTLSGGEAMCQKDFSLALLKSAHYYGINTAIETTANVPFETVKEFLEENTGKQRLQTP